VTARRRTEKQGEERKRETEHISQYRREESEDKIKKIEYEQTNRSTSCVQRQETTTRVADRGTWGTYAEVAEVLDSVSMADEEGARASQASRHIHSSFVHVPPHHSLQGAAACAVDIQEPPTVVASTQDSEGTSSQGEFGVVGPRSRGP